MKRKLIFPFMLAFGFWLNSYGLSLACDSYRGHREYSYNAQVAEPEDTYDINAEEPQERRTKRASGDDFIPVLGILVFAGVFWLSRRLRGVSPSRQGRSGGGDDNMYASRYYSSPGQESSSHSSHSDPSAGHFWGNPEDGTTVKSLWGTTKDE